MLTWLYVHMCVCEQQVVPLLSQPCRVDSLHTRALWAVNNMAPQPKNLDRARKVGEGGGSSCQQKKGGKSLTQGTETLNQCVEKETGQVDLTNPYFMLKDSTVQLSLKVDVLDEADYKAKSASGIQKIFTGA